MNPRTLTCTPAVVDPHTARIVLTGDLVYANGGELLDLVEELLGRDGVRRLRLDCAGVGFCDSYGLSTLLAAHRRATEAGAELRVENRSPALDRLLRRTSTLHHLTGIAEREREEADS